MAVLQKILGFFSYSALETEPVAAAPDTIYEIRPLTEKQLDEVWELNRRCFREGENYPRHTLQYLLSDPNTLSYRAATSQNETVGFVFVTITDDGAGHVTTIGVAPEHRKRGLAVRLMAHIEKALQKRSIHTIFLEVRITNTAAQNLYRQLNFSTVQHLPKYYSNGEDAYLMVKSF